MTTTVRTGQAPARISRVEFRRVDLLDLSLITSEANRHIHPCKGCVSTSMALCHWPCSCYPNHALGQVCDWMAEIYERWAAAHGVLIVTPVHWYQAPSVLKLMIDRLVCADGGNPDPTSTHGKDAAKAKALELAGRPYPKHLAGRTYGLVVHGDVAGAESVRRALSDWLDWMGLSTQDRLPDWVVSLVITSHTRPRSRGDRCLMCSSKRRTRCAASRRRSMPGSKHANVPPKTATRSRA